MPDDLDRRILKILQGNARKKATEIAKELGVAQSTLVERIRRLEEQGVITAYQTRVNPELVGLHVQAFISVTLNHHAAGNIHDFEEGIRSLPHIRACYHVTGRFDYVLHVAAADLKELGELVKTQIASLPAFGTSETYVVFSETKPDGGWPLPPVLPV